jgi:hypothetical protein
VFEVAKAGAGPEFLLDFLAGDEPTWDFQQDEQDLDGLAGELQPNTVLAEFLRIRGSVKGPKPHADRGLIELCHTFPKLC